MGKPLKMLARTTDDMFGLTEATTSSTPTLTGDKLVHYRNHLFPLHTGERLDSLVSSIQSKGILTPILVRLLPAGGDYYDEETYEILSGHNRFEAGKLAGLTEFPVYIKEDVSDEDAELIVLEANIEQRSMDELPLSVQIPIVSAYYHANKRQGKRNDLINKIDTDPAELEEPAETDPNNNPLSSMTAKTIRQLVRLAELSEDWYYLLDAYQVDKKGLPINAGVELSHIGIYGQDIIYDRVDCHKIAHITYKQAIALRELSADYNDGKSLPISLVDDILLGISDKSPKPKAIKVTFQPDAFKSFFEEEPTEAEMEKTIQEALKYYLRHIKPTETEALVDPNQVFFDEV